MNDNKEDHALLKILSPIIITLIICVAVVAVVAITMTFDWLENSNNDDNYNSQTEISSSVQGSSGGVSNYDTTTGSSSQSSSAEVEVKGLREIKINWVNGKIDVDYYDGNTISFTESGDVSGGKMRYRVQNGTLLIMEYENMKSVSASTFKKKNLSVKIPKNFVANEFSFETVSADITAKAINASQVEFETVKGNIDVSFIAQPRMIDIESVNGNVVLRLPDYITGYNLDMDTISGSFSNNAGFNQGDGAIEIDFESVNGNLILDKA